MSRALLVVRPGAAGWRPDGVVPLLHPDEGAAHAALCAAGLSVDIVDEGRFRSGFPGEEWDLVVVVHPGKESSRSVEAALQGRGGSLLRILSRPPVGGSGGPWIARRVVLREAGVPLRISRLPQRSRVEGWRQRLAFPPLATLRGEEGDEVVGRWGGGGAALLLRKRGALSIWTAGFPLDHLAAGDLSRVLGLMMKGRGGRLGACLPLPGEARAVVILLHDVEEALPDDPRGLASVRDGTEACLESQARQGFRATYNLVGTFAEQIPDLVRRMAEEGHEVASHGATHRVVADLDPAALRDEVVGAEERIGRVSGARVRGFRSPRSRWSGSLLELLAERGYLWNAEADASPFPYPVPGASRGRLVRIPVAVDDWDYVRHGASPRAVSRLWMREVLSAERRGCWVAIGSHPSVLGVHSSRMEAFGTFLEWLSSRRVRVMTLGEAAEWWLKRAGAPDGMRAEVVR